MKKHKKKYMKQHMKQHMKLHMKLHMNAISIKQRIKSMKQLINNIHLDACRSNRHPHMPSAHKLVESGLPPGPGPLHWCVAVGRSQLRRSCHVLLEIISPLFYGLQLDCKILSRKRKVV